MDNKKKKNIEEEAISKKETPTQTAENAPQGDSSNEEQLMRRQSAPRPTAESEARRMYNPAVSLKASCSNISIPVFHAFFT